MFAACPFQTLLAMKSEICTQNLTSAENIFKVIHNKKIKKWPESNTLPKLHYFSLLHQIFVLDIAYFVWLKSKIFWLPLPLPMVHIVLCQM